MPELQWPYPECHICDGNITHTSELLYEIGGYEKPRGARGGTNHVVAREQTGRTAHTYCVQQIGRQKALDL